MYVCCVYVLCFVVVYFYLCLSRVFVDVSYFVMGAAFEQSKQLHARSHALEFYSGGFS